MLGQSCLATHACALSPVSLSPHLDPPLPLQRSQMTGSFAKPAARVAPMAPTTTPPTSKSCVAQQGRTSASHHVRPASSPSM